MSIDEFKTFSGMPKAKSQNFSEPVSTLLLSSPNYIKQSGSTVPRLPQGRGDDWQLGAIDWQKQNARGPLMRDLGGPRPSGEIPTIDAQTAGTEGLNMLGVNRGYSGPPRLEFKPSHNPTQQSPMKYLEPGTKAIRLEGLAGKSAELYKQSPKWLQKEIDEKGIEVVRQPEVWSRMTNRMREIYWKEAGIASGNVRRALRRRGR